MIPVHFSVILPVYNRENRVTRAIDSVLRQTFQPFEIFVVNDGSTDNTPALLKSYGDQIKVIHQQNYGVSSARNKGITASSGEWIALLDSDDEWLPGKLQMQYEYICSHPDIKIFQTDEIWIRNGKRVNPMKKHSKKGGYIFYESLPLCIVSPSAVVIHRSLFHEYGLFNETLPVCEDYELWLKMGAHQPIGLIKEFGIIKYGGHEDQLSRKYWGMDRFRIRALENVLNEGQLSSEQRSAVIREIISKAEILQAGAVKRGNISSEWQRMIQHYQQEYM